MTAYLAGLAHIRCHEHELADEIDGVARAVLAAMAYPTKESEPVCSLSHAVLSKRSGFSISPIQRAQARLEALGLIERLPSRPKTPTRWRLVILEHGSERAMFSSPELSGEHGVLATSVGETEDIGRRDRSHRSERPKTSVGETDNPSDPAEGLPKAGADSSAPSSPLRSAAHELSASSSHEAEGRRLVRKGDGRRSRATPKPDLTKKRRRQMRELTPDECRSAIRRAVTREATPEAIAEELNTTPDNVSALVRRVFVEFDWQIEDGRATTKDLAQAMGGIHEMTARRELNAWREETSPTMRKFYADSGRSRSA